MFWPHASAAFSGLPLEKDPLQACQRPEPDSRQGEHGKVGHGEPVRTSKCEPGERKRQQGDDHHHR